MRFADLLLAARVRAGCRRPGGRCRRGLEGIPRSRRPRGRRPSSLGRHTVRHRCGIDTIRVSRLLNSGNAVRYPCVIILSSGVSKVRAGASRATRAVVLSGERWHRGSDMERRERLPDRWRTTVRASVTGSTDGSVQSNSSCEREGRHRSGTAADGGRCRRRSRARSGCRAAVATGRRRAPSDDSCAPSGPSRRRRDVDLVPDGILQFALAHHGEQDQAQAEADGRKGRHVLDLLQHDLGRRRRPVLRRRRDTSCRRSATAIPEGEKQ